MTDEINNNEAPAQEAPATEAPATESSDWRSGISEEFRESIGELQSIDDLAKGYVNAQKMIGNSIRIPSDNAGKEDLEAFYAKLESVPGVMRVPESNEELYNQLGRPESVDDYKLELDIDPEVWDSNKVGEFKNKAHELGLNSNQLNEILKYEQSRIDAYHEQIQSDRSACDAALKQSWGADYNNRMAGVHATLDVLREKHPEHVNALAQQASSNPVLYEILSELGKSYQETDHPSFRGKVEYGKTPQEAQAEIDEILRNKAHPYHSKVNSEQKVRAQEYMQNLFKIVYPD